MEEILNHLIPILALLIFVVAFIHVRKTNPENKKIRTRTSFKAIKRKEICPYCGIEMKKNWVRKSLGLSWNNSDTVYEEESEPEFICQKCGYKIEAVFTLKKN